MIDLNKYGSVYPCLVFGKVMAEQGHGSIINVSSMATYSAITRVLGYSMAKSAINIFTQWMAMEMALKFGDKIRVNAIAPGFFIGDQNRAILINPDGSYTERSKKVMAHTPMGRFRRHLRTERDRQIPLLGRGQLHYRCDHPRRRRFQFL